MRPTSHLSLLLFLQLAATAPLQIVLPAVCEDPYACESHLRHDPRPASTLSDPHFPSHQLTGTKPSNPDLTPDDDLESDSFDNTPVTPPWKTSPSIALSATRPLTSSYLLSLINSTPEDREQEREQEQEVEFENDPPLPAKPTSSLPNLRKLDSIRYMASLRSEPTSETHEITTKINLPPTAPCTPFSPYISSAYERIGQYQTLARENSDLLVVGIVVLFLTLVIIVELVQGILEWRTKMLNKRRRKGQIYLPDEEDCFSKKPFFLLPAPPPRNKLSPATYNDRYLRIEICVGPETGSEKNEFQGE